MQRLLFFFLIAFAGLTAKAQILINEVMQSNIDCIMDDIKEFPDSWVELYNPTDAAISLEGYAISLTDNIEEAYKLPKKSIAAKGYALIYCDKVSDDMHTDFRLESGKDGCIYLFDASGKVADSYVKMKKQPAPNISYGRETDGADTFGYMLTPTPKTANKGGIVSNKQILGDPVFSIPGKVYTATAKESIVLSLPDGAPEGTVIRYTLDGTEPTEKSTAYSSPISLTSKSRIVRAKLFCEGYLSPRAVTQSYIMHNRAQTIPIVSIVTDQKYFYDNSIGIYQGNEYDENSNFFQDWRRPINIEYFPNKGEEAVLNQLGETRIQGGYTRRMKFKSLAVYAHKRFGEKRLKYEFFPISKPGLTDFKSIILRNSGNDFDGLYFRDAAIQTLTAKYCDVDWQAYQPTAVYLNGSYLCMLNIRERSNEDNIFSNYNGLEDIDMVENWEELKTGDLEEFNKFKEFYSAEENAENTNMDNYAKVMDINEYLNMMVLEVFLSNTDFPGNNIVQWRPRTEDGKWRWVLKDTDFGLGLYGKSAEDKYIDWLYNTKSPEASNKPEHTVLFRRLMADKRFKDMFIDRMTIYMGKFLNKKAFTEIIDSINNVIKTEYPYHRALINQWWNPQPQEVTNAKNWAGNRETFMKKYLKSYFQIPGSLKSIVVDKEANGMPLNDYYITLNDTWLNDGLFSGQMFSGREIRLSATGLGEDTPELYGWKIKTIDSKGQSSETTKRGAQYSFTMPSDKDVVYAIPVLNSPTGIDNIEADFETEDGSVKQLFTIDGKRVDNPSVPGIYIKNGKKIIIK